ncbi:5'-methylthioadenosine/S-adenosylhomocysteine nucleosidase [uncultured Castellaniella sp.]|uniref:5'-methylthioadenosine/S-adenosylhomocysteine nucleosidase n=1 Tax=uncultured Castellaniella sp. TaxID=647907 RepID=UPI002632DE6D|nr:5'-methylthioadenosine/S-adenosylhomocysteine nucleosidase [uncultured Castellaniella sp.]
MNSRTSAACARGAPRPARIGPGRLLCAALLLTAMLWGGWPVRGLAAEPSAGQAAAAPAAGRLDDTPRMAIMSAFAPELALLRERLRQPHAITSDGVDFTTGTLEGQPVVLLLSGISMVNAAMNTQLLFDRFNVSHLVFSGIAGGVNPELRIGDVSVPARWGQYLELVMMRETGPGRYQAPASKTLSPFAPYGMMQPRDVRVRQAGSARIQEKFWFDADPRMLSVARSIETVPLRACDRQGLCVADRPRLVVGGNGVSGQAFVDNADFRRYAYRTFQANVLDMESAACAQVAWRSKVPFIAFRSLSDLAGGGPGENEMNAFLHIAADNSAQVLLAFLRAWPR